MKTYQVNHIGNDGKLYKVYRDLDIYQAEHMEQQLLAKGEDAYICEVIKMQKLKHTTTMQNFN